jgi:hypothetical protein
MWEAKVWINSQLQRLAGMDDVVHVQGMTPAITAKPVGGLAVLLPLCEWAAALPQLRYHSSRS